MTTHDHISWNTYDDVRTHYVLRYLLLLYSVQYYDHFFYFTMNRAPSQHGHDDCHDDDEANGADATWKRLSVMFQLASSDVESTSLTPAAASSYGYTNDDEYNHSNEVDGSLDGCGSSTDRRGGCGAWMGGPLVSSWHTCIYICHLQVYLSRLQHLS